MRPRPPNAGWVGDKKAAAVVCLPTDPGSATKIMNKPISLALVVGGIILIIYGVSASDSTASGFSRFFTGNPTDKTMWLLIGGVIATIVGAVGLLRGSRAP